MNYLNEEYKNLSDLDKKISYQVLSSFYKKINKKLMIKSTEQKIVKSFLRRLGIEESDM